MRHSIEGATRYLQDAHAMEVGALEAIDAFNPGYSSHEMSAAVGNYRQVCEDQVRAMAAQLEKYGAKVSATKNFVNALFGKAADWVGVNHEEEDRVALCLVRFYGTAQTKGALYDALAAYATALGDSELETLARKHREQEFAAAEVLFPFVWDAASYQEPERAGANFEL